MECEYRLPCGFCNNKNSPNFKQYCDLNKSSSKYSSKATTTGPFLGHEQFEFSSESENKEVTAKDIFGYDDFKTSK